MLIDHVLINGSFRINGSFGEDLIFVVGSEIGGNLKLEGGEDDDEIFMILSDALANADLGGQGADDFFFVFANTFLGDTEINGNGGNNEYSAGLTDPNEESNQFFGNLLKDNIINVAPVDFRTLLADLRMPN